MPHRANTIASIIEKRRPLSRKIESVESNLRELISELNDIENHRTTILQRIDRPTVIARGLNDIDFSSIQLKINKELEALAKLKIRFSRDTLNIGVVGRARQGKSRLLQSLTGLTADEIPDGDRQHCTGVRSTIRHNPNVDTHGEVSFYSEQSFFKDVIAPYYEKLSLGQKPNTLAEFTTKTLPSIPSDSPGATQEAMYEHLKRYHVNSSKYANLLDSSPLRIPKEQIREYVAQDNTNGDRIFFKYLAVKEVKIICTFPNSDVGQIALVDMPGLGDTGTGDEERLMKTLGEDIDAIIFVKMPQSTGDNWTDVDVKLYETASNSLKELTLDLWSFMILNHKTSESKINDNYKNCTDLAENISQQRIIVKECIIANCANVEEAKTLVLDRVLNYLATNINFLDQQYAKSCQERLFKLQRVISSELEKARQALVQAAPSQNEKLVFKRLYRSWKKDMTQALLRLLRDFKQHQLDEEDFFQPQVEKAIRSCQKDTGIPSLEEIQDRHDLRGSWKITYDEFLHKLRTHLTRNFGAMDTGLKQAVDDAKNRVVQVLVSKGSLGSLTQTRGPLFLKSMSETISDDYTHLKKAFQELWSFELAYKVNFHYRIRQHLNDLTPDDTSLQLSQSPTVEEVLDCLTQVHADTVFKCKEALESMYAEPRQAAFAAVEEFIDQVIRAEEAEDEWESFLYEVRSQIWPSEFPPVGEGSDVRQDWKKLIERAETASQPQSLQFLN